MKIKIIGIFVCALFLFGAMTGAVDTNTIQKSNIGNNKISSNEFFTTPTTTVRLKFFVHDECTKNISQMVADCNDIFDGADSGSRSVNGITQFGTNGTVVILPDSDFTNLDTKAGRKALLRKLKTQRENCSNGINVVIAPDGSFSYNGLTYFNKNSGTQDKDFGGIILRDSCNQDQMNKTLAHELLHALGLSHEQVKWKNPDTGEIESKPLATTIWNYYGPGDHRNIPASSLGNPVPPHGYAYYDKDGDCDCEDDDDEQPENAAGQKIWDIDGNCEFGDVNDTGNLLWGRADRTNTTLSSEQKNATYDTANNTPGYRQQNVGETVTPPVKEPSKSKGLWDILNDVAKKFLDIAGGLIHIYYDHGFIYFGLSLEEEVPDGAWATYYYLIDEDNDPTTGDPLGYDYLIDLLVRPDYKASALSEWDPAYHMFIEIATLDWEIAIGTEDVEDSGDCNEEEVDGMTIKWNVPIELLSLDLTGHMRFSAGAVDELGRESDTTAEYIISKAPATVPVLNLNPFNGDPGQTVTCYGYDYTPNTLVKIEFDCVHVGTTTTDSNGDFTTTFVVPSKSEGYYTVNAYDSKGKFHIRLFKVYNQPPNKPTRPVGQTSGNPNVEYEYESTTSDPESEQIYYWFDWGDGQNSGWVGSYSSGVTGKAKHSWTKGTYSIRVKAKDTNNNEGPWSDPLEVNMPRKKAIIDAIFLKFLERFSNQFPFLRYLMEF
jgi:hypothetical protein